MRNRYARKNVRRWGGLIALLLTVGSLAMTLGPAVSMAQGTPTATSTPAKTVNVELILDSSGSMAEELPSGQTRIEAAKQVLDQVIDAIPDRSGINVGFRVYGHKGTNTEAGKAESCQSTELKVPIKGVNKDALSAQVDSYKPVGWTPIALSLREAGSDFPPAADDVTNAIVLVTDGLETCGGNPCTASRALKQGNSAVTTHVIGFALAEQERQNLQCIVDESGGMLLGADSAETLSKALFQVLEELQVVVQNGFLEIESIGGVFPKATIQGEGGASDTNPKGKPFSITLTDKNKVEVPAGKYQVSWKNPSGQETKIDVEVKADQTTFIRGSIIRFPNGAGEIYLLTDQSGVVIWQDQIEEGDAVWVLPGIYRLDLQELTGDPILLSMQIQTKPGSVTKIDVTTAP